MYKSKNGNWYDIYNNKRQPIMSYIYKYIAIWCMDKSKITNLLNREKNSKHKFLIKR